MAKNVSVVDESGKVYGATYPKRAAGLVKKGRARFLDESTICLVRPPYYMEDERMDNQILSCIPDILQRIEEIVKNTNYVESAIQHVAEMDIDNENGMNMIGTIVMHREETNQKALDVLEKLALTALEVNSEE